MVQLLKKRLPLFFVFALVAVLIFAMAFTITDGVAAANDNGSAVGDISVGHISDIHYFPLEYCDQDVNNPDYQNHDFYYSMTGDTKLVLESGVILNATITNFIADAKQGIAPHYLVASGDLSKNGEHVALIDVANSMRYLQNEVRKISGYETFQVFATPGNHDLYNGSGALYDKVTGEGRVADGVSAAQFALIFAGLGYPNASIEQKDGVIILTEYLPENYWYSTYTGKYVESFNATDFNITYYNKSLQAVSKQATSPLKLEQYRNIGDGNNALTFSVELTAEASKAFSFLIIDASDREAANRGAYTRVSKEDFDNLTTTSIIPDDTYFLASSGEGNDGVINTGTPITNAVNLITAFANDKNVYRATKYDHITGGRITGECLEWIQAYTETQTGNKTDALNEESYIAVFHQNILPHFTQEDDILKDFTLYNWEYTAKEFLKLGIRYCLTGHMHSSDIADYTDAEGRTLYDMETGSSVSFDSPRRYTTLTRYDCNGKLGEQFSSSMYLNETLKELASTNIAKNPATWNDGGYKTAVAEYNAAKEGGNQALIAQKWAALLAVNPDYFTYTLHYDRLSSESYNEYINEEIYGQLVDRLLSHFISEKTVEPLIASVYGIFDKMDNVLGNFSDLLGGLSKYIINDVLLGGDIFGGFFPHNGVEYDNIYDYVSAILGDVVNMKFGKENIGNGYNAGKLTLAEMASFILVAHTQGNEVTLGVSTAEQFADLNGGNYADERFKNSSAFKMPNNKTYRLRFEAALTDFVGQCDSGILVEKLLDSLIKPILTDDDSLLKAIVNYRFDLRKAVTAGYITQYQYNGINDLVELAFEALKVEGDIELNAANFSIAEIFPQIVSIIKPTLSAVLGFTIEGNDLIGILEGFLDDYLVDSFYVGIGGILKNIVVSFATDDFKDLEELATPSTKLVLQPYADYKYGSTKLSYLNGLNNKSSVTNANNPATQDNGRVPGRVSANFDTVNGTTEFTLKFYTAEDVFPTFAYTDSKTAAENGAWTSVTTVPPVSVPYDNKDLSDRVNTDGYIQSKAQNGNVKVTTVSKPAYVPLIDLGLLCLTHSEVSYEETVDNKKKDVFYTAKDRHAVASNSVIYWNETTVTVSGLSPNTTYYYDIIGNYEASDGSNLSFSLVDFEKNIVDDGVGIESYDKNYFTFKTAANNTVKEFEFLTIADIQGMIQQMYDSSYAAMDAVTKFDSVNDYDFILNAGDMCDNGKNFAQWGYALNTYVQAFANTSMFMTAGNHENGSYAMANYFNYTAPDVRGIAPQTGKNGLYYSFNYANAHFVVLDTNDTTEGLLSEEQARWLKSDLKSSKQQWKFVLMHKSLYSGGSHSTDAEVVGMRAQLGAIFNTYGVNAVFAGHDHTYTTTCLLNGKGAVSELEDGGVKFAGSGVLYVTLGTMGTKFYEYGENPNVTPKFDEDNSVLSTLDTQTFGHVSVKENTVTYTGYKYNAETKDFTKISEIVLGNDNGVLVNAIRTATAGGETNFKVSFTGKNELEELIDTSILPRGYTVKYSVNDKLFEKAGDIKFSGGSADVKIMLIDSSNNVIDTIATVTVEKESYALYLALCIVIPVLVVGAVVAIIVLAALKKKGKLGKKPADNKA